MGAVDKALMDDTIIVAAGTYHENVILHRNVTITGEGMNATTINAGGTGKGVWIDSNLTVTLEDLALTNSGGGFTDNVGDAGVIVDVSSTLTLNRCRIYSNPGWGLINSGDTKILFSLIDHNGKDGLYLTQASKGVIQNSTIANNGQNGINVRANAVSVTVMNDIIANNGGYGISTAAGAPMVQLSYSDFWQNSAGNYTGSINPGSGNLALNPQFLSSSDYRLSPDSPAIDAGNPAAAYNDPDGSRNDMGAFPADGPMKPSELSASSPTLDQINLSWTDNSSDEGGFRIERSSNGADWAVIGQVAADTTTYSDTGLPCNTSYSYRVQAFRSSDGLNSAYSNVASASTRSCPAPDAPTNLTAQVVSPTQIDLSWADNSDNESDFRIERLPGGSSSWSQIATVDANATTYSNTGLSCGTSYSYRVRAHRSSDNKFSDYTASVSAKTLACAPDMGVLFDENEALIANSDTTPSTSDGTDFGSMNINSIKVAHSFRIANTGAARLLLNGKPVVDISGPAASDFKVTTQPPTTVGIDKFVTFEIAFDPSEAGTRTATVSIASNDSSKNPYTFSVQGVGNTTYYDLTINKTGTGDGTITSVQSGIDCGDTCTASFPDGMRVTLKAKPEIGSVFSGWSGDCSGAGYCSLTIKANQSMTVGFNPGSDLKPVRPVLISPQQKSFTNASSLTFEWSNDPASGLYRLQISHNSDLSNSVVNQVLTTNTYTISTLTDGQYFWRVRGTNAYNVSSSWSEVHSFRIDRVTPRTPTLSSPANDSHIYTTTPNFVWTNSPGKSIYHMQIAEDADFANIVYEKATANRAFTLPKDSALDYREYYWRVNAADATGNTSEWSAPNKVTIGLMRSPRHEAYTQNRTPTLRWTRVAGAMEMQLEVATDAGFSNVFLQKTLPGNQVAFRTGVLDYKMYFWRVRYMMDGAWSEWQPTRSFTVTPKLTKPVLTLPKNNAVLDTNTPTLTWRVVPTNGLDQANTYEIQIDNHSNFKYLEQVEFPVNTSYTTSALAPGHYFWRVRAINSLGYTGPWSSLQQFRVK